MAFCSAPGIRKKHSDAQSRGGAFRGDLGSVRNAPDAPDKLCNAAPFRWAVVVETTKAALRAGLHGVGRSYGDNGWRGGDQGRHPSRTARTRKDPFPTRSAYSATVMASLTLG